jgi:hypothetical protein
MKRLFAAAFGLLFAATLAGCGSTTDNLDFKVPSGYDAKVNTFIMSLWTKGDKNNPDSMLMLFKMPVKMDDSKFDSSTFTSSGGVKNAKIESTDKIQICGNHPAMLVKMTGTSDQNKGKDMDMEMLVTAWGGNTYMAMYGRPHGSTADPAGEDAIKSVCQKSAT